MVQFACAGRGHRITDTVIFQTTAEGENSIAHPQRPPRIPRRADTANAIAVLNAGSSSLKFSVFLQRRSKLELAARGQIERLDVAPRFVARDHTGALMLEKSWGEGVTLEHDAALDYTVAFVREKFAGHALHGVGHRVVHGGRRYVRPVLVDAPTLSDLEQYIPLAPLHQPHNLAPIRALLRQAPQLPQVACFDTAFHSGAPAVAMEFALPAAVTGRGVRRYGFHGLSYEYLASLLPGVDARAARGRTILLHLGNGSSMCATAGGRSVATTMGFTAADGLPMGTRCGSLDPGVILYLLDELKLDARAIEKLIYEESGLLGVSGISSDMRTLEASADPRARAAIDLYVYRIGRELGSLAAALGGLDAIVFTGGIGENSASVRQRVCEDAHWLGVELDAAANSAGSPLITTEASPVSAWVIPTNEELMIARHTARLIEGAPPNELMIPADDWANQQGEPI